MESRIKMFAADLLSIAQMSEYNVYLPIKDARKLVRISALHPLYATQRVASLKMSRATQKKFCNKKKKSFTFE